MGGGVFLKRKVVSELLESCSLQRLYCRLSLYAVVIEFLMAEIGRSLSILYYAINLAELPKILLSYTELKLLELF